MSTRRATLADVAHAAGVSVSTASVVFSGKTPVSDATAAKVRRAADDLGYTGPDPLAASLRRGRSGIIGVLHLGPLGIAFTDPIQRLTMDGLAEVVASIDASLLLVRSPADPASGNAPATPTVLATPIDAAVAFGLVPDASDELAALHARGVPVVVIEGESAPNVVQITLDNTAAQRRIAEYVRDHGHRDVAIVTLTRDLTVTRQRLRGAQEVFPDAPVVAAANSSMDEGLRIGRRLLHDARRPTAIIAQSDLLAAGVVRAAEELGIRVPEDLSVSGFDGVEIDGLAPYRLTTMVQPAAAKGRAAGAAVVALLAGEEPTSAHFTCVLREGGTVAVPGAPTAR